MKSLLLPLLALAASVVPSFAITVTTPSNGAPVTSPFSLVASTSACSSQPAVSMGYSLDYGSTTIVPTSFSAMVIAGSGQHILHVKCLGSSGASGWGVGCGGLKHSSPPRHFRAAFRNRAGKQHPNPAGMDMEQRPGNPRSRQRFQQPGGFTFIERSGQTVFHELYQPGRRNLSHHLRRRSQFHPFRL